MCLIVIHLSWLAAHKRGGRALHFLEVSLAEGETQRRTVKVGISAHARKSEFGCYNLRHAGGRQ